MQTPPHVRQTSPHARGWAALTCLLALVLTAVLGTARPAQAQLTLTTAGKALGFGLTTFASGFPNSGGVGPLGIVVTSAGGVMVADYPGNVRLFPTDTDGQNAATVAAAQNYGSSDSFGLAQVGGIIYMAHRSVGNVVQLNPSGTLNRVIVSSSEATGMTANPSNGHLFVSDYSNNIYDIDPIAKTSKVFVSGFPIDGLSLSLDDKTLYGADNSGGHIYGFDTGTGAQVFDSGFIAGGVDGTAAGYGKLAGNLFVNTNGGTLVEVSLATKVQTLIASGGSRGDFVTVDPSNGTLLLTQTDRILRLTPAGSFGPIPPPPTHLLWTNADGSASIWTVAAGGTVASTPAFGPIPGWAAKTIADGADGKTRLLWTRSDGMNAVWTVNDATGASTSTPGYGPIPGWNVTALSVGLDNQARLKWKRAGDGQSSVWTVAADGTYTSTPGFGPYGAWTAGPLAVGGDGLSHLLWGDGAGHFSLWTLDALSNFTSTQAYGPLLGWTPGSIAGGPDTGTRLLLNRYDGAMAVWTMSGAGAITSTPLYGPIPNWACHGLAVGSDGLTRVLWNRSDGASAVWTINADGSIGSTPLYGPIPGWSAVALSVAP